MWDGAMQIGISACFSSVSWKLAPSYTPCQQSNPSRTYKENGTLYVGQLSLRQPLPGTLLPPILHAVEALPQRLLVHAVYFVFPAV